MTFSTVNRDDLKAFIEWFGGNNVLTGDTIDEEYAHDELKTVHRRPDALLKATDEAAIRRLLAYANERGIPVTVRGSGTGLVGACVPVEGGVVLDMTPMNKILDLDKDNLTLDVEPGVLLLDIAEHVEKEGLFYAPDPGEKTATIGGNIATNAGGMRAVKYGVTRDWVLGLRVVLADGTAMDLGGKVVKNSSGYSLKDLIVGSEGTLAVIVKATLKLIPAPAKAISLLMPFSSREAALVAAPKLIAHTTLPTAVEFMEQDMWKYSESFLGKNIPHDEHAAYLLATYDATTEGAVDEIVECASAFAVDELDAHDVYLIDTDDRKQSVWNARGAFLEAVKASTTEIDECDVVLPRSQLPGYLSFIQDLSESTDLRIPYFGHVGDGNLHIYLCRDDLDEATWKEKTAIAFDAMYEEAAKCQGLVSGEHGIGYAKKTYLRRHSDARQLELMEAVKTAFDPKGILNPKKIL